VELGAQARAGSLKNNNEKKTREVLLQKKNGLVWK
jgi:hypothetical protein